MLIDIFLLKECLKNKLPEARYIKIIDYKKSSRRFGAERDKLSLVGHIVRITYVDEKRGVISTKSDKYNYELRFVAEEVEFTEEFMKVCNMDTYNVKPVKYDFNISEVSRIFQKKN